jgi:hypothetical protein
MNAEDFLGTPDKELVAALDKPFAWPQSGLTPLPWFPFTVAASAGAAEAAGRLARRTEQAYWYLRKLLRFTPRFRLLVLSRDDWPRYAEVEAYGIPHLTADAHLVVGSEPADAWTEVSVALAGALPAPALRNVCNVHGVHALHRDAPDLRHLAEALMAHELARVIAHQARATFGLAWLKDAFANYALVAVLGETDPAGLHRLGTLAEATRELASITPHPSKLGSRPRPSPFEAVLVQLALTRGAYLAYAQERGTALARWFGLARKGGAGCRSDFESLLSREVHPAIGALAAGRWGEIPQAA